ncbi:MAG: metallophosphoesterase [Chlamydiia bacterium]|nr:metallophosphoesterase [Chlamydiia bacterium]
MVRIAHISDLHFSNFSFNPLQFFSKRWIGNLNLLFNRSKHYLNERPFSLIPSFKKQGVTHVIISGDLTTTSSKKEFALAKSFVSRLKEEGMTVYVIPGNHDAYTKKADRKNVFYRFFPSPSSSPFSLKVHGMCKLPLCEGWTLVLLDTTCATSLTSSNGYFSPNLETNLTKLLQSIGAEEKVLLVNHFPFFQHERAGRRLINGKRLESLLKAFPTVQIYLHGHTHRRTAADLRESHLPLILESGSSGHTKGAWNLLELDKDSLTCRSFEWREEIEETCSNRYTFQNLPWYYKGLRFKCTGCGKCCTGKGYVWLEEEDISNLSKKLSLSKEDFLKKYTRQVGFDRSLTEDPVTDDCIFLKDKSTCAVYDARPKQCRTFPWWTDQLNSPKEWEEAKLRCEGIDHEEAPLVSFKEIEKELSK